MAILIGMISQKGGVGKSTLSRLVAREYASAGWEVKIADMDIRQGTSTKWKQRRDQRALQPVVAVEPFRSPAHALKLTDQYDLMIFDAPPHSMASTLEIARASDVLILPTGVCVDDLEPSVLLAHELVEKGIPSARLAFVLVKVGESEIEISEAKKYLEKAGYKVLEGELPEKTGYRRATNEGKSVSEASHPGLKAKAEGLAQSIIDFVKGSQRTKRKDHANEYSAT